MAGPHDHYSLFHRVMCPARLTAFAAGFCRLLPVVGKIGRVVCFALRMSSL